MGLILVIVVVVILLGGGIPWGSYTAPGHYWGAGPWGGGGLGIVLVILLVLFLMGRL